MGRRFLLALVVCECVLAPLAWAQALTGSITGVVSDPTNARIPGVLVEMSNLGTQVVLRATTTETGEYTIPLLQPGRYRLTATANGFRSSVLDRILIDSGRVVRLDMVMELGQVQEKVEVTGAAPLLESETSTLGQFIENKTVTDMPLNGRRVGDLLSLVGNAVWVTGDVIRPRVFIGGGRADEQQWLIDGVNGADVTTSQAQTLFKPPMEATQEMRILQNNYSAEYGNSGAGMVTITTKSGTNTFHGSAYEFLQNDAMNARNFFAASMPPLRWNVFGASAGGPIRKNKTFFFAHNEWQKQRIGNVRLFTVPTALERTGDFSRTTNAAGARTLIYDWSTQRTVGSQTVRDPFQGNITPPSRLDPVGAKLASFYPLPNATPTNAAGANNFNGNDTTALNITSFTTKVDHILNERNRLSYRLILNNFPTSVTVLFPVAGADAFANTTARRALSHMFNYIRNLTPTMVNDFRVNVQSRFYNFYPPEQNAGWPQKLGLNGVTGLAFPYVTASGYVNVGYSNHGRLQTPCNDKDIVESVSKFTGAHSFKFGGEIRLVRIAEADRTLESGQLIFNALATGLPGAGNTGNAIASMLTGFPNEGLVNLPDYLDRRMQYYAVFAQDDWKVKSNFTLNLGVRWEAHTPRIDANNRQNGFDFTQINPVGHAGRDDLRGAERTAPECLQRRLEQRRTADRPGVETESEQPDGGSRGLWHLLCTTVAGGDHYGEWFWFAGRLDDARQRHHRTVPAKKRLSDSVSRGTRSGFRCGPLGAERNICPTDSRQEPAAGLCPDVESEHPA